MVETEFTVEINGNTLAGTVCIPYKAKTCPMVLLIHGSGPLDRDANLRGFKLNVFNIIAHDLVKIGIGSLRYDKRGCGKSAGDYNSTGHLDLVEDALGLVSYLKQQEYCDHKHIYLLGYSEGTIIAPQVSIRDRSIAGLLLLCPFTQKIEVLLEQQAKQISKEIQNLKGIKGLLMKPLVRLFGNPVTLQENLIAKVKKSSTSTIKFRLKTINALWLREIFNVDAKSIYPQVNCPMLVIGGEKDIQCPPEDVGEIQKLSKQNVETHIIPNMTHILRSDKNEASFFNYKHLIKQEMEVEVMQLCQEWLQKQLS